MYRTLDLFSGIGGFSLGLERTGGFKTVAFCEIEPFCRRVLAKHWPDVFIHDDVRTLNKDSLCRGYAENALLNQLCKETAGNSASVRTAITNIKKAAEQKTRPGTTNAPPSAEEAFLIAMAGDAPAAESANTLSWPLITSAITEATSAQHIKGLCGSLLSSEDFLTTIKFFVITATWRNPFTVPAHIKEILRVEPHHDADRLAADGIAVDVICGGFPCQDISVAGKGAGINGERSGLWREYARLIGEIRPRFVIVENVAALLGRGLERVLGDLAALGFDAEWHCIPASAVGAPHRRDRLWIVGNAIGQPQPTKIRAREGALFQRTILGGAGPIVADANSARLQASRSEQARAHGRHAGRMPAASGWWRVEPDVGRVAHGVPSRVDRLRALGNAVVPQIPELIGRAILHSDSVMRGRA